MLYYKNTEFLIIIGNKYGQALVFDMENCNFSSTYNLPNEKNPEGFFESEPKSQIKNGKLITFHENNREEKVF